MVLKIPKMSMNTFLVIIPILFFNSCTFEFIKYYPFIKPLVIGCMLIWLLLTLMQGRLSKIYPIIVPMLLYVLFLITLFIWGVEQYIPMLGVNLSNIIYLLFFICVFVAYSNKYQKNDRAIIVFVWTIDTLVACIYTIRRLLENPNLSRLLSTGSFHQTTEVIKARGVISFGVIYGLVFILMTYSFIMIHQSKGKILYALLIVVFSYTLIVVQFTIAILLTIIGIVILYISYNTPQTNKILKFVIIFTMGIFAIVFLPIFLKSVVNSNILGYELNSRVAEIQRFILGNSMYGTDMMVRFSQYLISLSTFIYSFGFGKLWFPDMEVGSHSEVLDGLGNYGIAYFIFIIAFVMLYKLVLNKITEKRAKHLYKIVGIMYIMLSILNTSTWAPILLDVFVIIPFICLNQGEK